MNYLKSIILLSLFFSTLLVQAQTGTIRGKVIDNATGEELIGVTVLIAGTTNGAATDLEGNFAIKVEPGTYDVQASFVSYETVTVSGVIVQAGEVTLIEKIPLGESVEQLAEVVITAEAIKTTEAALLTVKKKSPNMIDGISSESFKRIGDSDAAGAIRRVPGVSVQGGQYVFVRGLGDRYTKTNLDNMEIPGLDPDRNAIQIDIFPTNVIDNIVVYKTFTPELSADFVGGTVNIETKDFPEEKTLNVSASLGYNPAMHLNSDYLTYPGGGTDWLGFDDGTRELPFNSREGDIPPPGQDNPTTRAITQSFSPYMASRTKTSLPNMSLGLSAGNQFEKSGYTLGYNAALNYQNNNTYFENAIDAAYLKPNSKSETELEPDTRFFGPLGINDVQVSALLGGAIKTNYSKISLQGLHIQNGTQRTAMRTRVRSNENFNTSVVDNLEYTERFLTNALLKGEHFFPTIDAELQWKGSATFSTINDQDVRITPFTMDEDDGSLSIVPQEGGEPNRIWRLLDEQNYVGKLDFTKNIKVNGNDSKLRAGVSNIYKTRDFEIQDFFISIRGSQAALELDGDPDRLLAEENILSENEGRGTAINDRYVESNTYSGRVNILGAYLSSELSFTEKLKSIVGVRVEQYTQHYTGLNQEALTGSPAGRVFEDEKVLDSFEFFPSVNLIYEVVENSNIRASYSRTIARPSFKELSTAEIQDVLTGRTFIGNIDLVETNIDNYDLRWEYFLSEGQMFSIGAFYKYFQNPIELVRQPTQPNDFKPTNVGDATTYGIEFELRKKLDFVSPVLENFTFVTNLTFTEAQVEIDSTERVGRENGLRDGEELSDTRDFLGQAPFIVNASINYDNFENGWQAGLSFNRQSRTLAVVGINRAPDTYAVPFNSLNFNITKRFGASDQNTIGLRVTNILGDTIDREVSSFNSADYLETSRDPGRAFRIKYSRSF